MGILEELAAQRKAEQLLEESKERQKDAVYFFSQMHFDKAAHNASLALRLDPLNATAWGTRGAARRKLEDHLGAIRDYDEAIKLEPDNASLYLNRGVAWSSLEGEGNLNKAIRDLTTALSLNPESSESYAARASAWLRQEQYHKAEEDVKAALDIDPGNLMAKRTLQGVEVGLGKLERRKRDQHRNRVYSVWALQEKEEAEELERQKELRKEEVQKQADWRKKLLEAKERRRLKEKNLSFKQKLARAATLLDPPPIDPNATWT